MMDTGPAILFTRIGLLCDFLAFFLATPEILGEKGLNKLQNHLLFFLWWIAVILFLITLLGIFPLLISPILLPIIVVVEALSPWQISNYFNFGIAFFPIFVILCAVISWIPAKLMKLVESLAGNEQFRRRFLNLGILSFAFGSSRNSLGLSDL